jgi:hypothetical protein
MKQYIEMMGFKFRDRVSGFDGVAESVSFDLYGCVQVALRPSVTKDDKGAMTMQEGRWFDASRLERIPGARVMEVPTFERLASSVPMPGPADKSSIR